MVPRIHSTSPSSAYNYDKRERSPTNIVGGQLSLCALRQLCSAGNLSAFSSCSKENGGSLTTKIRKPSEDVAAEKKPTPIRRGHWRNRWFICVPDPIFEGGTAPHNPTRLPDGTWLSWCKWPSAEIAEQKALEDIALNVLMCGDKYLGPVFFPEEGTV